MSYGQSFDMVVDVPMSNPQQTLCQRKTDTVFICLWTEAVLSTTNLDYDYPIGISHPLHMSMPPQSVPSHYVSKICLHTYLSLRFCAGRCSFQTTQHPHLRHFHQCLKPCPHGPCLAQTASKTCLAHQYSDLFQNEVHVCSVQTPFEVP